MNLAFRLLMCFSIAKPCFLDWLSISRKEIQPLALYAHFRCSFEFKWKSSLVSNLL